MSNIARSRPVAYKYQDCLDFVSELSLGQSVIVIFCRNFVSSA